MRHFALGSVLLLASAQLALAKNISVNVGGASLLFDPPFVDAEAGDVVQFFFKQKNHTVTQSTFDKPCQPQPSGFDSGFVFVPPDKTTDFQVAQLQVKDRNPIWAYCRQGNHCTQGMVFAVNPGTQLAAFQAAAKGTPISSGSPTVSSPSAPAATSSGTSSGTDHKITVGGPGLLTFSPPNITAQVGDTITFEFRQKNHTVTASSFDFPCQDSSSTGGFDSGYKPVGDGVTTFPTYTVKVNDTKPIWAFCRQGTHCKSGMVFAANTDESSPKNFAAFKALAMGTGGSTSAYPPSQSSAAWRPSSSMAVVLGLFAAALLL